MLEKRVTVHYVNLDECPTNGVKFFIAEKVFESTGSHRECVTFEKFVQWARGRSLNNLIILDNCDKALHSQKNELQDAIQKVVDSSDSVKFLMSSRETTLYVGEFEQYKLHELSTKAACELLQARLPSGVNITMEEKEELARLTGNVPLALQITGSLLRLPELGSPKFVIAELEKNLITTLSPEQLQENMQINASFTLSYNYLGSEEQRIGQLLSNFPGSFTIEQCVTILGNFYPVNIFGKAINTLITQRSLLDVAANKRYQFHSLIWEYFLEKQKESNIAVTQKFACYFQTYFLGQLITATSLYHMQYRNSLAILDRERHNFLLLFSDIKNNKTKCDPSTMLVSVTVAIDNGLFSTRFSHSDLLPVIENIISYFDSLDMLELDSSLSDSYLLLMYHLIDFRDEVNSTEYAMEIFYHHKLKIEAIKTEKSVHYPKILIKASDLCANLGQHNRAIEFHKHAMQYLHKITCKDYCSYYNLGHYHMLDNEYGKAIHFLTLSLETESPSLIQKMSTFVKLHASYHNTYNYCQKRLVLQEIELLLPEVVKLPYYELFHSMDLLNGILSLLHKADSIKARNMLIECVVNIIMMAAEDDILVNLNYPAVSASTLYQNGNYVAAARLGTYVLNSIMQSPNFKHDNLSLTLLAVTGAAKMFAGNISQGFDDMEKVMETIIESPELYNQNVQ